MAPFLAHSLGVTGRGELAAATAPYLLAVAIGTLGLPDAITQSIASGFRLGRSSWAVVLVLILGSGLAVSLVLLLAAPTLAENGSPLVASLIVLAGVGTIPALGIAIVRAIAAGTHAWGIVAAERIANGGLKIVATVILALTEQLNLFTATLVIAYAPILAGVAYLVLPLIYRPSRQDPLTNPLSTVAFGLKAWVGSAAGVLLMRVNQMLIMPLAGAPQLGLYAVAVNISEIPLIVSGAIREVTYSSDALQRDNARLVLTARLNLIICSAIALPLLGSIYLWLPLVFGGEFIAAVPSTLLLAAAVLSGVPGSIAGSSLAARGFPSLRSRSILLGCIANVAAVFALVPSFGALGASLAFFFGTAISSNGSIYYATKKFGMRFSDFYKIRLGDFNELRLVLVRFLPNKG